MSLFAIADLHLSSDGSKSMDKFGPRWKDYMTRLKQNWGKIVTEDDTVILPGDISWSLKLEDALQDLQFLNSLPGKKLIGKGNHDFWWTTAAKMNAFFNANQLNSIKLLYNNAYKTEDMIVCGTRGWFVEESQQNTVGSVDYLRIVNRETIRLSMSLDEAVRLRLKKENENLPILVFFHFPPVWNEFVCREIVDVLHKYQITTCYFGHIHSAYSAPPKITFEGIDFIFCASDYLGFTPLLVRSPEK